MAPMLPKTWREGYQRHGYIQINDFLQTHSIELIKNDLIELTQRSIEMHQAPAITRRFNLDASNCKHLPGLATVLQHQQLLRVLRYVAGYWGQPIIAVQCIHTDRDDPSGQHDPQTEWHVDTFHSTAKAWLFLHEVKADEGPFAYIPGSHKPSSQRLAWEKHQSIHAAEHSNPLHAQGSFRASPEELRTLGYGEPMLGTVQENTLVVADTSGFHRRTPSPQTTVRVEIYLSLRRNPFWAGLYPSLLGIPYIKKHWAQLAWSLYRRMNEKGLPSWQATDQMGLGTEELAKIHAPR